MGRMYEDLEGVAVGITSRVQEGFYGGLSRNFKPISTVLGILGTCEAIYAAADEQYAVAACLGIIGVGTFLARNQST